MYRRLLWISLLLCPLLVSAQEASTPPADTAAPPIDVQGLKECLRSNLPEMSMVQNIRLTSSDQGGGRELKARVYGMRLEQEVAVMISVSAPADMSNSRYLVIAGTEKDAMYLYLPALNKTRRVVGSMAGQSLWGTDFSYEDIKLLRGVLAQGSFSFDGDQPWAGGPAWRVTILPEEGVESQYTKVTLVVDAQRCIIVEGEFFDDSGPVKKLTVDAEDLQLVDGKHWARRIQVQSHRRNSRSELVIDDYDFDPELRARLFNPRSFHRGR